MGAADMTESKNQHEPAAVAWRDGVVRLLDQRKLPREEVYLDCATVEATADAITAMVVRGAPAIGIAAAYAVVQARQQYLTQQAYQQALAYLRAARPTAVNLAWAIDTLAQQPQTVKALLLAAKQIHADDITANQTMADLGCAWIEKHCQPGRQAITHCHTGAIATGGIGTALGVLKQAYRQQLVSRIYADETRPWLQGARLTAWELAKNGIEHRLIADSASGSVMAGGKVAVIAVGADRITANGDVINKIGTYNLAVLAKYHGIPFMVVAPQSTVDRQTASGAEVEIEQRDAAEVLTVAGQRHTADNSKVENPAFDVTPAELISVYVTELGASDDIGVLA